LIRTGRWRLGCCFLRRRCCFLCPEGVRLVSGMCPFPVRKLSALCPVGVRFWLEAKGWGLEARRSGVGDWWFGFMAGCSKEKIIFGAAIKETRNGVLFEEKWDC